MRAVRLTNRTHPGILAAVRLIEEDNGGHLIGTLYPGEPLDLNTLMIPVKHRAFADEVEPALLALRNEHRLQEDGHPFYIFCCGAEHDSRPIMDARPGLQRAHEFLNLWFDGWEFP